MDHRRTTSAILTAVAGGGLGWNGGYKVLAMFNPARRWTSALLALAAFGITDASFVVQAQQCPPGSKIIIDPGLVPRRPHFTKEQYLRSMAGGSDQTPAEREYITRLMMEQNQRRCPALC